MACAYVDTDNVKMRRYLISGPLVLDALRSAVFIDGEKFPVSEAEFIVLYLLAQREGERITFERLYIDRWEPEDGADYRAQARKEMRNLIEQFNAAGRGQIWIEVSPGEEYGYRSKRLRTYSGFAARGGY